MLKSLKGKISFIYLCLVLLIAVVGTASFINFYFLNKDIDGLMSANYQSIRIIHTMLEANERQDSAMLIFISIDKKKGIEIFSQNDKIFKVQLNSEIENVTEKGEKELVEKVYLHYSNYLKLFAQVQQVRNERGTKSSLVFYDSKILPEFHKLKQTLQSISKLNEKVMFDAKANAIQKSQDSIYIILLLTFVTIMGGFFISQYFANRFLSPIYSLIKATKLLKAGHLDQQAKVLSNDEIGELAVEFNNMAKRLYEFEKSALGSILSEKNRFLTVVKNISDPLIVLDNFYRITILNNACETFFNISEETAKNKHFLDVINNNELFLHISEKPKTSDEFSSLEKHEFDEYRSEKILHITFNDEEYYLNVVATKVKDIQSNSTGTIVLFQNVTALKELEKTRTNFIATISHEFKTPLTSIMMGTDLLSNEGIGVLNGVQRTIIAALNEDCERLSTLVNDIMELTKLESGDSVINFVPCSISEIIYITYKQFKPLADQKKVNLEIVVPDNLPLVYADFEKVTWVLNNLVSNALKYTIIGDEILISTSVTNNELYVSVKDTGVGIPDEYRTSIFNRFFQVKGNDLEIRGTGLGLSVAKEIIEIHGGRIWCESKINFGSNFIFTLKLG